MVLWILYVYKLAKCPLICLDDLVGDPPPHTHTHTHTHSPPRLFPTARYDIDIVHALYQWYLGVIRILRTEEEEHRTGPASIFFQ